MCFYKLKKLKEDTMKFRPLLDRVVIKRTIEENRTAGGIIIPDTAKEKPSQGNPNFYPAKVPKTKKKSGQDKFPNRISLAE